MANKNLLKKLIHTGASVLLLVSHLLPSAPIYAATVGGTSLTPGMDYDTGDHTWTSQQYLNSNSYSTAGKTSFSAFTNGGSFTLVSNSTSSAGYAIFNGALDMRNATTLTAQISVLDNLYANWQNSGDSLGFILTPQSTSTLKANIGNATGPQLGIGGLANSFFAGRDLFMNTSIVDNYIDGNTPGVATRGGGNEIAIRHTNSSGSLVALSGQGYGVNNALGTNTPGDAWMNAADNTFAGGPGSSALENVYLSWQPDATNSAPKGYTSGTLNFQLATQGSSSYTYSVSTHTNMANSMSIGFVGATGNNVGTLKLNLLSTNTLNSAKGQAQV